MYLQLHMYKLDVRICTYTHKPVLPLYQRLNSIPYYITQLILSFSLFHNKNVQCEIATRHELIHVLRRHLLTHTQTNCIQLVKEADLQNRPKPPYCRFFIKLLVIQM